MISGTASVDELAAGAAEISSFGSEPITLSGVTGLSLIAELRRSAREEVLPPGLHPIVPPAMSLLAWDVGDSPWGAFSAAFVRVVCRSGARARTFCVGAAASTQDAIDGLRSQLGFPAQRADVALRRRYDGVDLTVAQIGKAGDGTTNRNSAGPMLAVSALDPDPLSVGDLQQVGSINLARTPLGLRARPGRDASCAVPRGAAGRPNRRIRRRRLGAIATGPVLGRQLLGVAGRHRDSRHRLRLRSCVARR